MKWEGILVREIIQYICLSCEECKLDTEAHQMETQYDNQVSFLLKQEQSSHQKQEMSFKKSTCECVKNIQILFFFHSFFSQLHLSTLGGTRVRVGVSWTLEFLVLFFTGSYHCKDVTNSQNCLVFSFINLYDIVLRQSGIISPTHIYRLHHHYYHHYYLPTRLNNNIRVSSSLYYSLSIYFRSSR